MFCICAFLLGCAEKNLREFESTALKTSSIHWNSNLADMSRHSQELSEAYRGAAEKTARDQDIAAAITIVAAVGTVSGLVSDASTAAVSNRALVGATATTVATRTTPKTAIQGLYTASKRMNCVATTAQIGRYLLTGPAVSTKTRDSARAATFGAIAEIQIIAREALIRSVESFQTVRDNLINAIPTAEQKDAIDALRNKDGSDSAETLDVAILNQYLGLLDNCLADAAEVTAASKIDKKD